MPGVWLPEALWSIAREIDFGKLRSAGGGSTTPRYCPKRFLSRRSLSVSIRYRDKNGA